MGHLLGLEDIRFYARIKKNLMNDEYKKFLWKPTYLTQDQIDKVVEKARSLKK